jgi:L-lactate dehydrogenase complex protein LldG
MSAVVDSRGRVLERIRAASRGSAANAEKAAGSYVTLPRDYIFRGSMSAEARLERMAERLREYDAEVVECKPEGLVEAIRAQLAASGRKTFVIPEGLPQEWMAAGFDWKIDRNLAVSAVELAEGVVTACFCGVAESGTIVLHHSPTEGRRVITLLPDWHLCVLRASQIVETLPEYFQRAETGSREPGTGGQGTAKLPALVTWISGPSATADIEMTRIKGVHGPRFLHVVLVRDGE